MRQGRLIATGVMLAFCLFALWQSLLLSLTDRLGPGPGFFPFWLALIGAMLAVALLIATWREPNTAPPDAASDDVRIMPHGAGGVRWAAIIVLLAAVTIAMEFIGFRLAMLVFNVALVITLGERRWWMIALFAVLGSFGVYYVFTTWLDVLLPTGSLGV